MEITENFLDNINKILGVPTKEQLDIYEFVKENKQCAEVLESLYRIYVDKEPDQYAPWVIELAEKIVNGKTPYEALEAIKSHIKEINNE